MSEAAVVKPLMRGVLHSFGAAVAVGAGLMLASLVSGRALLAVSVFATCLVVLFTVSATYHRVQWAPAARQWMRRADHSTIFLLIAGTYTPIASLGLPPETSTRVLVLVWLGAALGIAQSLFWVQAPKVVAALLAVAVGWLIVPELGVLRQTAGDVVMGLVLAGGIVYSLGAVAYATRRPVLWPRVFGYHEVFHLLTLIGAALHFEAVRRLVLARLAG